MKLVTRITLALAMLALAVPALACSGDKVKTTDKQAAKPAVAAVEKAQAATKAEAAKPEARPTTAPN